MIIDELKFKQLYDERKEDKEISEILNIPVTTITKFRKKLKLPSQKDRLRNENKQRFLNLYKEGKNDSEISKLLNVNHVTIKNWREALNLPTNFSYTYKFDINKFKELYDKGLCYNEIASILGSSDSAIQAYASSLGLSNNLCNKVIPSYEEEQIILGTLYGDGNLSKKLPNRHVHLNFAHSLAQEQYCKWKEIKLARFECSGFYKSEYDKRTNKDYHCYMVNTRVSEYLTNIYDNYYYSNRTKYINKENLYKLDGLGIAVWFMDDGFKEEYGYKIATNCFSKQDLQIIQEFFLNKFNIQVSIHNNNIIYIGAKSKDIFTELIFPYIHKDCLYKLHSRPKTPLNEESPIKDNLVLNLQEIEENA